MDREKSGFGCYQFWLFCRQFFCAIGIQGLFSVKFGMLFQLSLGISVKLASGKNEDNGKKEINGEE